MKGLTLRICLPADAAALRRIAERDSAAELAGRALGAEVEGELVAAIGLDSRRVIADPFRPTADAVDLLRRRAGQIARAEHGRRHLRRRRLTGSATAAAGEAR